MLETILVIIGIMMISILLLREVKRIWITTRVMNSPMFQNIKKLAKEKQLKGTIDQLTKDLNAIVKSKDDTDDEKKSTKKDKDVMYR